MGKPGFGSEPVLKKEKIKLGAAMHITGRAVQQEYVAIFSIGQMLIFFSDVIYIILFITFITVFTTCNPAGTRM